MAAAVLSACGTSVSSRSAGLPVDAAAEAGDYRVNYPGGPKPPGYADLSFFELLSLARDVEYNSPGSFSGLAAKSDFAAIGKLSAVVEGRTLGLARGYGTHTSVGVFEVERVLRGNPRTTAFVEFLHVPVVESRDLMARMPGDRMLFFVYDTSKYPVKTVFEERKGVPLGEPLFSPFTPLGLVIERGGALLFPLEPDKNLWLTTAAKTLEGAVNLAFPP